MNSLTQYRVRQADPEAARALVLGFWQRIGFAPMGGAVDPAIRYDWLYCRSPAGPARLYLLYETTGDEVVGFLAAIPRRFAIDGQLVTASLLADFVVDPAHRSAFPALALQREARAHEKLDRAFVYGLPDTKAVPIFKRLGATVVSESVRCVRILKTRRALARVIWAPIAFVLGLLMDMLDASQLSLRLVGSGLNAKWDSHWGSSADLVWTAARDQLDFVGERSAAYLEWRFGSASGRAHELFVVSTRDDHPVAYFVCARDGGTLQVQDFLTAGTSSQQRDAVLHLVRAARRQGCGAVEMDLAGHHAPHRAIRAAQFIDRNTRPLFVMAGENPPALTAGSMLFTRADEDV